MKLPAIEQCSQDQFLVNLRNEDERGFLSAKKSSNQSFLARRRFYFCFELLKKYLSQDKKNTRIADMACGTGTLGLLLAEEGYCVDFIDNEPKFFDYINLKKNQGNIHFVKGDCSSYITSQPYSALFFGEALEHMSDPTQTLDNLRKNLKTGGLLCLTTPNGNFVNCYEPCWNEVKEQKERNKKMANTLGNHVCEFTPKELSELVKLAGFSILEHKLILSDQISRKSLLRRILSFPILGYLDNKYSAKKNHEGKTWGRTQVILAQRIH